MSFWSESVFPRFLEWSARDNAELKELRARALAPAQGRVLELGFGTGLNLPFYPPAVTEIVAVDPNPGMSRIAHERMQALGRTVEHHQISAESLPFDRNSFDNVVCTLTLCSIPNVTAALEEVSRVLKPGGQLLFFEHGRHADASVARWQDRFDPLWGRVFDGCHINRDIAQLVRAAGLQMSGVEHPPMRGPRMVSYLYLGRATRPAA
ncbi:MAG TPA: methyltransferase domain-containing protein [Steroidobacteraceae bacterium]|jgi:ubiquinone/menaquinone biosynthesis C-methylase UbiE|nr:methyltransferase domain-containing protein [Steroidobacteraceae bacterium]